MSFLGPFCAALMASTTWAVPLTRDSRMAAFLLSDHAYSPSRHGRFVRAARAFAAHLGSSPNDDEALIHQ